MRVGGAGLQARRGCRGAGRGRAGGAHRGRACRLRAVRGPPGGGGDRGQEGGQHSDRGGAPDPQVPGRLSRGVARVHGGRCAAVRLRVHRGGDPLHLRARPGARVPAGVHVPSARDAGPLGGHLHRPHAARRVRRLSDAAARHPRPARARARPAAPVAGTGRGDPQPGGVAAREPSEGADPDGHRGGQDVHGGQRLLPAGAPRRRGPGPVPGG